MTHCLFLFVKICFHCNQFESGICNDISRNQIRLQNKTVSHECTQNTTPGSDGIYFQTFVASTEEVLQFKFFEP